MPRDLTSFKMYAQIQRQPTELARLLEAPEPVAEASALLHRAGRVFTVGIGTSSNAALTAATLLRLAGLEATAWTSYDFALYGPALRASDAAVLFSHSGRKQQSRATLQRLATANVPAVWVAGAGAEENPATVTLRTVPRETSAAFTISHTAAMLLTARLAEALQPGVVGDLAALPAAVHEALGLDATVRALAEAWQDVGSIIAVGAGPQEPSAHEVAIKINEAARLRARGYAAEQFLHGPQAQVQADDALLLFATPGAALERSRVVAQFGLDVGLPVAWVAPLPGPAGVAPLPVPDVGEWLAPIVQAVPGQLLAAHLAALRDLDADSFRRDEPAFAAAYQRFAL